MKKIVWILFWAAIAPSVAYGGVADEYFSDKQQNLSPSEKQALELSRAWKNGEAFGIGPTRGQNGSVRFVYGAQQPEVVCAVLELCDIALQPGEMVKSVHLGDKVRWSLQAAVSGFGANAVQHLIVKPGDVGLETSLVVTTNRRTYHIQLHSTRDEYMPSVSFVYPELVLTKFRRARQARQRQQQQHEYRNTLPTTNTYLGDLSFEYEIDGSAPWKPVRVYTDGKKTIIEMPKTMNHRAAPVLLVVRDEGGLFDDRDTAMVNYRLQGSRFIVDTVFHKAVLISGVGDDQKRITITRSK